MNDLSVPADQREALEIAGRLIDAGIPIFSAPPCPSAWGTGTCPRSGHADGRHEYDLPPKWQLTVPSRVWLEKWQPGHALAAVGGHAADFLDEDPRHGGTASVQQLKDAGQWPNVYGVAETPSGGFHYLIAPLHEREANAFLPGVDYQGGAPDGAGRAFVWIAPTVKRSKDPNGQGELRPYRWLQPPDLEWLGEFNGSDGTGDHIIARLAAARTRTKATAPDPRATKEFTEAEARQFCQITLDRLMRAEIGKIEEAANAAAAQLSHFVPHFWTAEYAYAVLMAALGDTAYDPNHPASGWTAEKFHAVLGHDRDRAPDDWRAVRKPEHVEDVKPELDDVDALLAEMLTPEQVAGQEPPKSLVKGLLNLDSESWLIGEPGSKKSFVALDMAGHVATGRDWQGCRVTQSRVVYIVAEGAGGMTLRVRAWEKTYGPMGTEVFILPHPVQSKEIAKWAVLVEACRRLRPGLVVIDTQARVTVGLKENDATDMGVYVAAVSAIREATGACVLTVHHTGRQGGNARGSSALDGAQSTELTILRQGDGLAARLLTTKQKDIEAAPEMPLTFERIDLGLNDEGEQLTSLVLSADPFLKADGTAPDEVDHGQVGAISEPQPWTHALFGHHLQETKRRILQTLADTAGQVGITNSACGRLVRERWHGGKPFGRGAGQLKEANFTENWNALLEHVLPDGEMLIINPSGEKRAVNPSVLPR